MTSGKADYAWSAYGFTARQAEVLQLLVWDSPSQEIARHLHISARTVEGHLAVMRRQVGCTTLAGLAAWAVATGAVAPPDSRREGQSGIPKARPPYQGTAQPSWTDLRPSVIADPE